MTNTTENADQATTETTAEVTTPEAPTTPPADQGQEHPATTELGANDDPTGDADESTLPGSTGSDAALDAALSSATPETVATVAGALAELADEVTPPPSRRYVARSHYRQGADEERRIVVTDEKTGEDLMGTTWVKVGDTQACAAQQAEAYAWLDERYPDHADPAAYQAD